jgi:hypothetical protein
LNSDRKHLAAVISDNGADNISKTGPNRPISAYSELIGNFLPVSAPVADFRDVDFQQ